MGESEKSIRQTFQSRADYDVGVASRRYCFQEYKADFSEKHNAATRVTKVVMSRAETSQISTMFLPPVNRTMRVIDRKFFQKSIPLAAARVTTLQIAQCRSQLGRDLLNIDRVAVMRPDPSDEGDAQGRKALLLQPTIQPNDSRTWSPTLQALVDEGRVSVVPYDLKLSYNNWAYCQTRTLLPRM